MHFSCICLFQRPVRLNDEQGEQSKRRPLVNQWPSGVYRIHHKAFETQYKMEHLMYSFPQSILMSMVLKLGATQISLGWHSVWEAEHIHCSLQLPWEGQTHFHFSGPGLGRKKVVTVCDGSASRRAGMGIWGRRQ